MLVAATSAVVNFCASRRWLTIALGVLALVATGAYDVRHFSINTDVDALVSNTVPWRQRLTTLTDAFPQAAISVVVQAPTPEGAEQATDGLAAALGKETELIPSVVQPESGAFFEQSQLLFQSVPALKETLGKLQGARPFLAPLASDPSLRGLATMLSTTAKAVTHGQLKLDQLAWPLGRANAALTDVLGRQPVMFSWQELTQGKPATTSERRHFIEAQPKLDYTALQPGRAATNAIEKAAAGLKLKDRFGATVSLTGQVPMNDDEFQVIRSSLPRDTLIATIGVLVVLWFALRSWKLMAGVFFSLLVGLAVTAALGLMLVGSFNLISIAFFVLFVGLGVDFGIQFSVRYRTQRHEHGDLMTALHTTAIKVAVPLSLAAAATSIGFFAFLPTSYVGLSQLGLIAGCGMVVAFLCSISLVPASLAVLNPPGEPEHVGFAWLAPLDNLLQHHRAVVIAGTAIVVLAALPALWHLSFDFNPIDLQDPNAPSVAAAKALQDSPAAGATNAEILAPSLAQADAMAKRLVGLPQVSTAATLTSLIPADQDEKLRVIGGAAGSLLDMILPSRVAPTPSDADDVAALRTAASDLTGAAGNVQGAGAESARQTAALLEKLAAAAPDLRQAARTAFLTPLTYDLDALHKSLEAKPVTKTSLPPVLLRDWQLPDGRARVEIVPKQDQGKSADLQAFAKAVLAAEPTASGPAIGFYESKQTVIEAFVEAAAIALAAIAIMLFLALRRITDVLLTLVPLLIAGAVTLEVCALSDFALNFANVIALPLLLGVGVAFKIYYIVAWREGKTGLLQSTLTRAVVFSAMTNAIAFGSLWSSSNPGMSSMGALMFLSLLCTLSAAVFFQPVLMGRPRRVSAQARSGSFLHQPGE